MQATRGTKKGNQLADIVIYYTPIFSFLNLAYFYEDAFEDAGTNGTKCSSPCE